jgi:hypothetical protein
VELGEERCGLVRCQLECMLCWSSVPVTQHIVYGIEEYADVLAVHRQSARINSSTCLAWLTFAIHWLPCMQRCLDAARALFADMAVGEEGIRRAHEAK